MATEAGERAAIYVRVSDPKQREGTSLETQEEACRSYANEHGYRVADAHVYREVHTGNELWERPALTELRAAARRREFDIVVMYALDRFSRNKAHIYIVTEEWDRAGVRLETVTETFEDTPEGRLLRDVKAYVAEVERLKIIARTQRGIRARAAKGKPLPGPRPPYGYLWGDASKSFLIPDPVTAPVVQRIFHEAVAGRSLRQIAAGLTSDRVPTPTQRVAGWSFPAVRWILSQTIYAGEMEAFRYS